MSGKLFLYCTIIVLFILSFIYRKKIYQFFKGSPYLLCWALMFVSNLGFSPRVQYTTRMLSLLFSWTVILFYDHGIIKVERNNAPFFLYSSYLTFGLLSCFYSIRMIQSFVKIVELFTDLIIITKLYQLFSRNNNLKKTIDLTVYLCFILLSISLVGFFLYPSYFANTGSQASKSVLGIRLSNGFLGANKASALAAFCLIWLLILNSKSNLLHYVMLFCCLTVMFFSQSRATLILLPIIIFFKIFTFSQKKYSYIYLFSYIFLVLILICTGIKYKDNIYQYLLRGQSNEEVMNGTGRLVMWEMSRDFISKRPFLGYGFGVGGELVGEKYYGVATVHNGIYETLLGTGIIGLFLLSLLFVYVSYIIIFNLKIARLQNNVADILIYFYFIIRTVTSLGIANWHSPELMIWLLFVFSINKTKSFQMAYQQTTNNVFI